jgi:GNAT superfamily N-acetyltransferase
VEGLFVRPGVRHCGVARKLIHASRLWARRQGCGAFASDRAGRIVLDSRFVASEQSEAAAQLVS